MTLRGIIENTQVVNPGLSTGNTDDPQMIIVSIYDTLDDDSGDEVYQIILGEEPAVTGVVDNDEDKFTPIGATQCVITAHTDEIFNFEYFASGNNREFRVDIDINELGRTVFSGWLSLDNMQETFQAVPNEIILTAFDGLGSLKDQPLTDFNGDNPTGPNRIIDYIAWILAKTGKQQDIYCIANVRHKDIDDHFFNAMYLDARTFEEEIGVSEDCYTCLEKILGEWCRIKDYKGRWYIYAPDEYDGNDMRQYVFDWQGSPVGELAPASLIKEIGAGKVSSWMGDDNTIRTLQLRIGLLKETYNFNFPKELVCNQDFSRSDAPEPVGNTENEITTGEPECWDYLREDTDTDNEGIDQPPSVGAVGELRIEYDFGIESSRYLSVGVAGAFRHYFKSAPFEVAAKDKVTFSFDVRLDTDQAITVISAAIVKLLGDDGNLYDWDPATGAWELQTPTGGWFTNPWQVDVTGEDTTEWKNISHTSKEVPVNGKLYIRLVNNGLAGVETWFSNLNISIDAYLVGGYRIFRGQYHKISIDQELTASRDNEVYISDSPRKDYKGALLRREIGGELYSGSIQFGSFGIVIPGNVAAQYYPSQYLYINTASVQNYFRVISSVYNVIGDTTAITFTTDPGFIGTEPGTINVAAFVLGTLYYAYNVFPGGVPDATYYHPFGYMQAFWVWNQYNRNMRLFEGDIDGIDTGSLDADDLPDIPDCVHKFSLTDGSPSTMNKYFLMLHREQDLNLSSMQGAVLAEVYDSAIGKVYSDTHEFKYITND